MRMILMLPLLLAACAGPAVPVLPVAPAVWSRDGAGLAADAWWAQLGQDAGLLQLLSEARLANADLSLAQLRLTRARLQSDEAARSQWPVPDGSLDASRTHDLKAGGRADASRVTLNLTWEADLWQRLAQRREAAVRDAQAAEADVAAARLLLDTELIRQWWRLTGLETRSRLAAEARADRVVALTLAEVQWQAGSAAADAVRQARIALAESEAAVVRVGQEQDTVRYAINLLRGKDPSAGLPPVPAVLPTLPPLQAGLPSAVLARRPDLAAAEARLRAALGREAAAGGDFLPVFSLTGSLGTSSTSLLQFLSSPVATVGAGLTLPFLDAGKLRLARAQQQNEVAMAGETYRKAFLTALSEVEAGLSGAAHARHQLDLAGRRRRDAAAQVAAARARFAAGETDRSAWLDALQSERLQHQSELDQRLAVLEAQLVLFRALGGVPDPA